ncbi:MAG: hypothetical protein ACKV22_00740 [Bryobacteraceae bacterium]
MKANRRIGSRITLAATCAMVIGIGVIAVRARADVWDKKTVLTVYEPIQVEETYLDPGTYVFKLMNSSSDRHIVQIFKGDQDRLINTVLAIPNYRLQPTGESRFTFYETPPGSARAMRAWFYPGDNFGQEFRYPRELRQIALAAAPPVTLPPEPPPPPVVTQPAEPEPQAAIEPAAKEEPATLAQAAPPPPPPQAQPEPPPAEEPKELPQTATPFPLIGAGGFLLLAAYGLSRINRLT